MSGTPRTRLHFSRSNGLLSRLIRWWTHSEWSHVAIETERGVYESVAQGFVHHPVGTWTKSNTITYETIPICLPNAPDAQAWLELTLGARYDFLGVIAYVLPWVRGTPRGYYCSEAAKLWLEAGGVPVLNEPLHPGALRWYLRGLTAAEEMMTDD